MSAILFEPCAGVVEVNRRNCGDTTAFFTIKVNDKEITGIATGIEIEMSGNYQFLHTVNNFIYFYAFGDRIGMINITGIGFVKVCGTTKGGLLELYDYYMANRAAVSGNKSAQLTITADAGGARTFRGFLTGMRMDMKATESTSTVGYWTLRFEVVPTAR